MYSFNGCGAHLLYTPSIWHLYVYICTYLCIRQRAHAASFMICNQTGGFQALNLNFLICLSSSSLSFSPPFTSSLFVLLHVLETVFLQLWPSLHLSPSHLCPVLSQWSRLPISMVTGWCSKRAVAALPNWMLTGSPSDLAATPSACVVE